MLKKTVLGLITIVAAIVEFATAEPMPIVSDFTGGTIQSVYYGDSTGDVVGFSFTADIDLRVTALGVGDDASDGVLNMAHPVGLWDAASRELIASTTVNATDPLVGGFYYAELESTVMLTAGGEYVLGALYIDSQEMQIDHFTSNPSTMTLSNISNTSAVYPHAENLGFVFPENTSSGNPARLGPNMLAEPISNQAPNVASDNGLCGSGWNTNQPLKDITGDAAQELIIASSRNTLNMVDADGLAAITAARRITAVAADGTPIFKTPWITINSPKIFKADWSVGQRFSPAGSAGQISCDNRTYATYDSGSGPQQWLIHVGGYMVWDNLAYRDISHIRMWVFDLGGNLRNTFNIKGVVGWKIDTNRLRIVDYNGDGNDDLVIARVRQDKPGSTLFDHRTKVFDLLNGTLLHTLDTGYVKEDQNLN